MKNINTIILEIYNFSALTWRIMDSKELLNYTIFTLMADKREC